MQQEIDASRNIERNIIKEIIRECHPKKLYPNENFMTYLIKLLLLDPNWGITDDFVTSRVNVGKFVAHVIRQLEERNDPNLMTLQMQFYFACNLDNMDNLVKKSRTDLLDRLVRLKYEMFNINNRNSRTDLVRLITMIVHYITLVSGMGNPMNEEVFQEALAAFNSVMNEMEIKEFMGFSFSKKDILINQVIKIVSGIRLFNKDSDKGGASIFDLPSLLEKSLYFIREDLQTFLKKTMEKVNLLTTVVDKWYSLEQNVEDDGLKMVGKSSNETDKQNIEHVKDLLVFHRQCELFIRQIMEKLQNIEDLYHQINRGFQYTLREIYNIINVKIAIPAKMVFPLFITLSNKWTDLQTQVLLLTRYNKIITNLKGFSKNVQYSKTLLHSMLGGTGGPLTDAERLQETANLRIKSVNPDIEITKLQDFPNIDDIDFQYLGFCSWKLIKTKGGLIPGNPSMGIATYKKMNFVFSIPEASMEFSKNPEGLVNEILDLARKKPHLVNFLVIRDEMERVRNIEELAKIKSLVNLAQDKEVQAVQAPCAQIYPNYYWNVWDLKRKALHLANLSKRKTVSTQTHKSHFINTVNTQTYQTREKEVQTRNDNYTNVPTPSTFIFGLRGRNDDKQFIINLTRPVSD